VAELLFGAPNVGASASITTDRITTLTTDSTTPMIARRIANPSPRPIIRLPASVAIAPTAASGNTYPEISDDNVADSPAITAHSVFGERQMRWTRSTMLIVS